MIYKSRNVKKTNEVKRYGDGKKRGGGVAIVYNMNKFNRDPALFWTRVFAARIAQNVWAITAVFSACLVGSEMCIRDSIHLVLSRVLSFVIGTHLRGHSGALMGKFLNVADAVTEFSSGKAGGEDRHRNEQLGFTFTTFGHNITVRVWRTRTRKRTLSQLHVHACRPELASTET